MQTLLVPGFHPGLLCRRSGLQGHKPVGLSHQPCLRNVTLDRDALVPVRALCREVGSGIKLAKKDGLDTNLSIVSSIALCSRPKLCQPCLRNVALDRKKLGP